MMLLLEPLNTAVDHKGYYLSSSRGAFAIIEETGSDWVKVLRLALLTMLRETTLGRIQIMLEFRRDI